MLRANISKKLYVVGMSKKLSGEWIRLPLTKRKKKNMKKKILIPTSSEKGRHLLLAILRGRSK